MRMKDSKTHVENVTAPKAEFDALLDKLLKSPPLPKSAIPPKRASRKDRSGARPQSSGPKAGEK